MAHLKFILRIFMCNVGKIDRVLRLLMGLAIIGWGLMTHNWWGGLGLVLLVTAAMSFCPFYSILKINTGCRRPE